MNLPAFYLKLFLRPIPLRHYHKNLISPVTSYLMDEDNQVSQFPVSYVNRLGKLINARELLLAGKIEPSDFKSLKMDYDNKVNAINLRLTALKERFKDKINIQPLVINAIKTLCNLPRLYQTATIEDKRYLVEIIFNGMLIYDKDGYRTTNLNHISEIIHLKNKELQEHKRGEKYL